MNKSLCDHFGNPIAYSPASLTRRGLAYLLDRLSELLFYFALLFVPYWVLLYGFNFSTTVDKVIEQFSLVVSFVSVHLLATVGADIANLILSIVVTVALAITLLSVVYLIHLPLAVFERATSGRSPGKYLFSLQTVSENGKIPTVSQLLLKHLSKGTELFFSVISVLSTTHQQTLADLLAKTFVKQKDSLVKNPFDEMTILKWQPMVDSREIAGIHILSPQSGISLKNQHAREWIK